jgi:PKD repeat protein
MLFGAVLTGVLGPSWAQEPAQGAADQKDLYFLVVDKSQSMRSLVNPVRGALVECVGKLPANTEVRLVFFDDRASRVKAWRRMDLAAKGDFSEYAHANFEPNGQTRLYDTVAEVFQSVARESASFRTVRVVILSDGDDNQSKTCKSWADVERLTDLRLLQNRKDTFISWYTIGPDWNPKDQPSADSGINVYAVPQADKLDLKPDAPSARFTAYPSKASTGEEVTFELVSPSGVAAAQWAFGDGVTSTELNPRHKYTAEGTYDISLRVQGPGGTNEFGRPGYIRIAKDIPLEAKFRWGPMPARVGVPVQLMDESLGGPLSWRWDIASVGTRTERNPAVTFDAPGPYDVKLTIQKGAATQVYPDKVVVLPPPPDPSFSVDPKTGQVEFGQVVRFRVGSNMAGWVHSWAVGDVTLPNAPQVEWKADRRGRIEVTHTVESDGGRRQAPFTLFVEEGLAARMRWTPEEPRANEPVQFMSECTGGPQSYRWLFSGIGAKNEPNPRVVFAREGTVDVVLTISRDGKSISTPPTSIVVKAPLPDADFVAEPEAVAFGQPVQAKAKRTEAGWTHSWKAGAKELGTGEAIAFTPQTPGWIEVVHVVESTGGTNQVTKKVFVEKEPAKLLTASFRAEPAVGRGSLDVQFTDTSKGEIAGWSWDFGDGGRSDEQNPMHRYQNASHDEQTFTPRLVVRNSKGDEARDPGETRVTLKPPWPTWLKVLAGAVVGVLAWVCLVVPFLLGPLLLPGKNVALKTDFSSHSLRRLAKKRSSVFWPRSHVTIGSGNDDIQIQTGSAAKECLAVIARRPASKQYVLTPLRPDGVHETIASRGPDGKMVDTHQIVTARRTLTNGQRLQIGSVLFVWSQPR